MTDINIVRDMNIIINLIREQLLQEHKGSTYKG